jgi:RNA polymerase sigma-70 factor, ECF subfamily
MPLASDANTIRGIALAGKLDLIPVPRDEDRDMQSTLTRTVEEARVSDEDLMALIRDEDSDALDMLFSRHSRLVFSIALRILRDIGEAEEVVQECFLYVYRKAVIFEPSRGSAKVWIVQVAYSRARDRKAHLSRRGFYIHTDIESLRPDDLLTGQGDVEREIGAKLDFDRLQCAFEDLTAIQRETLKLFYFEDMGLREISEQLREPVGNVRHHFYRGLERLRKSGVVERLRNRHNG